MGQRSQRDLKYEKIFDVRFFMALFKDGGGHVARNAEEL